MKRVLLSLLLAAAFAGCQAPATATWVRSEVYFGQTKPSGEAIAEADWQAFMDGVVTPQFPAGLTVIDGAGQWRNATGHIDREPSKVLILVYPNSQEIEARINAIRAEYCQRFAQEAVLKITSRADVSF